MSLVLTFLICLISFLILKYKLITLKNQGKRLSSRINQYSIYNFLIIFIPCISFLLLWEFIQPIILQNIVLQNIPDSINQKISSNILLTLLEKQSLPSEFKSIQPYFDTMLLNYNNLIDNFQFYKIVIIFLASSLIAILNYRNINEFFNARRKIEKFILYFLVLASIIAILTTLGIIFSLIFETIEFFKRESFIDFIFGTHWSPQIAIAAHQEGSSGSFGFLPVLWGTLYISFVALCISIPLGLMTAIYLSEYMSHKAKSYIKPAIEILAGIPTIVYGFLAVNIVTPIFQDVFGAFQIALNSESVLIAGSVMGVMLIPFISSLSEDVISTVPKNIKDAGYGVGSTKSEVMIKILIPAALPGITGSIILATSRAIGETMIVVMAAGLVANFTVNPTEAVTTITVQIVTLLVGDQEFDNVKTYAAFALGFTLFFTTLILNLISLYILNKYHKAYE